MKTDQLQSALGKAFPANQIRFNKPNDYYDPSFDVDVDFMKMLRVSVINKEDFFVKIEIFDASVDKAGYVRETPIRKTIYMGDLPCNKKKDDYDEEFLITVLKNWENFSK